MQTQTSENKLSSNLALAVMFIFVVYMLIANGCSQLTVSQSESVNNVSQHQIIESTLEYDQLIFNTDSIQVTSKLNTKTLGKKGYAPETLQRMGGNMFPLRFYSRFWFA